MLGKRTKVEGEEAGSRSTSRVSLRSLTSRSDYPKAKAVVCLYANRNGFPAIPDVHGGNIESIFVEGTAADHCCSDLLRLEKDVEPSLVS